MTGATDRVVARIAAPVALRRALAAGLMLAATLAHAALFDDDEARLQIRELRAQVVAGQQAVNERLNKLEAAVQDKKALVDLALLVDSLKADIAKLRGQN